MKNHKLLASSLSGILCAALISGSVGVNAASVETQSKTGEGVSKTQVFYEYYDDADFIVTLPKTITLDENKTIDYPVKVEGIISPTRTVTVYPIDKVKSEEGTNFLMTNSLVQTADPVVATVTQPKTIWSASDVANSVETTDNNVSATDLTLGSWSGEIVFRITLDGEDGTPLDKVGNIVAGGSYPAGIVTTLPEGSKITLPDGSVLEGIKGDFRLDAPGSYTIELEDGTTVTFTVVDSSAVPISSLVDGGVYDTGLKLTVEDGSTLLINGEEVTATDGVYVLDEEGDYDITYESSTEFAAANITIKHRHVWIDGVCSVCGDEKSDYGTIIGNIVDGGTYSVGTTLQVEDGYSITVNGEEVHESDKVAYTFSEAGEYSIEATKDGETKTANISVVEDNSIPVSSLINGETYPSGTKIKIPEGSTVIINGEVIDGTSGEYELGVGENNIVMTNSNGNTTIAIITIHEHSYIESVGKEATCTEDGEISYDCECGSNYTSIVEALGHEMDDDMRYGYVECIRCGYDEYEVKEVGSMSDLTTYFTYKEDSENHTVTITGNNYSAVSDKDITVYGAYLIAGTPYRTHVAGCLVSNKTTGVTIKDGVKADSCQYLFGNCARLASIDLHNLNTKQCTSMKKMFGNASAFIYNSGASSAKDYVNTRMTTLDLSVLNTRNVTDMSDMVSNLVNLSSLNVSGLDTSKVTNMTRMFAQFDGYSSASTSSSFTTLDLSNFDTSNVTSMRGMFSNCKSLTTLDLGNFDTSNVKDMAFMFGGCSGLNSLDVSNFNTSKVTNMMAMFSDCIEDLSYSYQVGVRGVEELKIPTLDLSNFDTSNVTSMSHMFSGCTALQNVNLTNWNTLNVGNVYLMFDGCTALQELHLCSFNLSKVTSGNYIFRGTSNLAAVYVSAAWNAPYLTNAFQNSKSSKVTVIENCGVCNLAA